MQEELHKVYVSKDSYVALWKFSNVDTNKHILLTHGTFSSRNIYKGLVEQLVSKGYTCWIYEWRSHGDSPVSKTKFDLETVADDLKFVVEYLKTKNVNSFYAVGHSGGGISLAIFLMNYPEYNKAVKGLVLFACQAFGACETKWNYFRLLVSKYGCKLFNKVPKAIVGGEVSEDYYFMHKWFDWNLTGEFIGRFGVDYKQTITTPVLSIFAKGDTFIAPAPGCYGFLELFEKSKAILASKENGFIEDYNHTRILYSSSAKKEIYPLVLDWLE